MTTPITLSGRAAAAAHLTAFTAMALIATSFPIAAEITQALDPSVMMAVRFTMAVLLFAPIVHYRVGLVWPGFGGLWRYGLIAACMDAFFWTMYEGLRTTSSLNTAAISVTIPGFTAIFSAVLMRERMGWQRLTALAMGMIGAVWVVFRGDPERFIGLHLAYGDIIFFFGCIAMGLYATLVSVLHRGEPVLRLSFWIIVMAGVWFILAANVGLVNAPWGSVRLLEWSGLVWIVVGPTVITFFMIQSITIKIGGTRVQAYSYLIPAFVLLIDWGAGRGLPTAMTLPGIVIVLIASVIVQWGTPRYLARREG
jgi:drug/metabolite transporter (DMT)-like permease